MKTAPPDARAAPEALIKEARRRQRRRWLAVGVAVAVVLADLAGLAAGLAGQRPGRPGPHGRHPGPQPARQAATLLGRFAWYAAGLDDGALAGSLLCAVWG